MTLLQIPVPFFRQQTKYTCGPACLRMLFAFHRRRVGEDPIAHAAGTTARTGTARSAMMRAAQKYGFTCRISSKGTWKDIRNNVRVGLPVLVNYREPAYEMGHYAVVTGLDRSMVYLHDPYNGRNFTLSIAAFKKRWLGHRTRDQEHGWLMTIMPPSRATSSRRGRLHRRGE